ncbi:hypothetical protein ACS5PN_03875 [Roseateles sp. NT4]|uniref:hypothetical protein n=1 Tax=Roseateles sp. NT4 TaxID=3453715 RepID=UPI003EEBD9C2
MSGPIPHQVAQAAQGFAFAAEAAALGLSAREFAVLKSKASILDAQDARKKAGVMTAPARWWQECPLRVRTLLVNLGAKTEGDAATRARLPWDAFGPGDQTSIAATAAELLRGLKGGDCLGW